MNEQLMDVWKLIDIQTPQAQEYALPRLFLYSWKLRFFRRVEPGSAGSEKPWSAVPVIKWAGGKRQLMDEIKKRLPKQIQTYYEPFFGGGATFFSLGQDKAVINDFNGQLVNLYRKIQRRPVEVRFELRRIQDEYNQLPDLQAKQDCYMTLRGEYNDCIRREQYTIRAAALLIFLNKAGFNGLYRVNRKGLYNTSFGKRDAVKLYDEKNYWTVFCRLHDTDIQNSDFEAACKNAQPGDFVFFDPPYYDTWDAYQPGGFSEADHRRLAELFRTLSERGVYCMLTNNDCDFIRELYADYTIDTVDVRRSINRDGAKRTGREIIIVNYDYTMAHNSDEPEWFLEEAS